MPKNIEATTNFSYHPELLAFLDPNLFPTPGSGNQASPAFNRNLLREQSVTPDTLRFYLGPILEAYNTGKLRGLEENEPDKNIVISTFCEWTGMPVAESETKIRRYLQMTDEIIVDFEDNFLGPSLELNQKHPQRVKSCQNLEAVLDLSIKSKQPLENFAARRKLVMAIILARIENHDPPDKELVVQVLQEIWDPEQPPQETDLDSLHDPVTRECLAFKTGGNEEWSFSCNPKSDLAQEVLFHRQKIPVGRLTNGQELSLLVREKTPFSTLLKIVRKGCTDPNEVQDQICLTAVSSSVNSCRLFSLLKRVAEQKGFKIYPRESPGDNHHKNPSFKCPKIVIEIVDPQTSASQIVEIKLTTPRSFLDYLYTPREGLAHHLYKARSFAEAAERLYPRAIYPNLNYQRAAELYTAAEEARISQEFTRVSPKLKISS